MTAYVATRNFTHQRAPHLRGWDVTKGDIFDVPDDELAEWSTEIGNGSIAAASLYRPGGTDVAVADGGTGASTAAGARTNLGVVPLAATATTTGIHVNDSAEDPAITIGNAPGSAGFAGTGTPNRALGALAIYQKFGDEAGGTNAPIEHTTQAAYVLANYYGPTSDDSMEAFSAFVGAKDTGTTYTQTRPVTALEGIAQVEGANVVSGATYAVGVASRVNVLADAAVTEAFGFRSTVNSSGGPDFGTISTFVAFGQPVAAPATTAYGVKVVDQISSETALRLGKSAFGGAFDAKLTGNADSSVSMVLLTLPATADVAGGLTGITIRGASDQTKRLQEWWGAGAGTAGSFIDSSGAINTRLSLGIRAKVSDPSAPATDNVLIYQRASGSLGQLCARFPTGAIKVIANEAPADPLGWGIVTTVAPGAWGTTATWGTANASRYARVIAGGTISKVGLHVGVQSGNICVSVFSNTGSGRSAAPGTRTATSGAVSCPASGYAEIALGTTVTVEAGDWIAMSCDNTTASFVMSSNINSDLYSGMGYGGSSEHPLPSTPGSLTATTSRQPLLIGVP